VLHEVSERSWQQVWAARQLDESIPSTLGRLLAADGHDTGFGDLTDASWRSHVHDVARRLGLEPGASVFDVGCGAGAFLFPLWEAGHVVGGLDASAALVDLASTALPDGRFLVADAADLDLDAPYDAVVSSGVFLYFPDLDYAARVLVRMAESARRGIAVLDVPDLAQRDEALRMRRGFMSEAEYEERYRGLDHLYFPREWFAETLGRDADVWDQDIEGYANAAHRFNVTVRL
jgi:trans-aconitate methyltransferase